MVLCLNSFGDKYSHFPTLWVLVLILGKGNLEILDSATITVSFHAPPETIPSASTCIIKETNSLILLPLNYFTTTTTGPHLYLPPSFSDIIMHNRRASELYGYITYLATILQKAIYFACLRTALTILIG